MRDRDEWFSFLPLAMVAKREIMHVPYGPQRLSIILSSAAGCPETIVSTYSDFRSDLLAMSRMRVWRGQCGLNGGIK